MAAGTKAETVIDIIEKIPLKQRNLVQEITLDMAGNMGLIAKKCFPNATRVTDRFHVQKLATEALQEIRIKYRWEAIDQENDAIEKAKKSKINFQSILLSNEIPLNNYWPEAAISCTKPNRNGLKIKQSVLRYYLNYILRFKKDTI
jgi:transposase